MKSLLKIRGKKVGVWHPAISLLGAAFLLAPLFGSIAAEGSLTSVQKALQREQFLFGEPSGVLDDATRAALRRFQTQRGLPATGEIDTATLQALESMTEPDVPKPSAGPKPSGPPAPEAIVEKDRAFLKQVEGRRETPSSGTPAPSIQPPPPAQPQQLPPPEPIGTLPPSNPIKSESTQRKSEVQTRASENPRQAATRRIEPPRAFSGDPISPRRSLEQDIIFASPSRRPTSLPAPVRGKIIVRESAPGSMAPPGVHVTTSHTTRTGPDGRTYIYERKTTTYPGTPFPAGRKAAPAYSRPKEDRLFRKRFEKTGDRSRKRRRWRGGVQWRGEVVSY